MTDKKPVIVYGASGYTGRLVCEYLRELHVPFIAAGRDRARTQAVMDKIPGIETAEYEVAEVEHSVKALAKLFDGASVISNMVGPLFPHFPNLNTLRGDRYRFVEQSWFDTESERELHQPECDWLDFVCTAGPRQRLGHDHSDGQRRRRQQQRRQPLVHCDRHSGQSGAHA